MPEPVDLMRATEILLDARHDTSAGLEARELLLPIVGAALTELGLLRDTVIARGEDISDMRAELKLARSLRLDWPSIRAVLKPEVHTPARTLAYLKTLGWVKDHERRGGEDWHDQPDRDGRSHWVFVPLDTEFADWDKRMAVLVRDLADDLGLGELGVLADIVEATDA